MIYSVDISTDDITTAKISSNLYLRNYFTLTVNAVNDAPVLLQPLDGLEIIEDSEAAAMVHSSVFGDVTHFIDNDDLYLFKDFTLTVNAVNDAPVLLQCFEDFRILGDSEAAAMVHRFS